MLSRLRLNDLSEKSSKLLFLLPVVISKIENQDFSALSNFYRYELPNTDLLDLEIKLWKKAWSFKPEN